MIDQYRRTIRTMTDGTEGFAPCPELLTEDELAFFLRIPEVSNSRNHHNVIEHLKRYRNLPRIRICNKALYPTQAIRRWIEKETTNNN
ncbi:MAG: hypothetical protein ACYSWQ_12895 [Planctomycetota bacterium]